MEEVTKDHEDDKYAEDDKVDEDDTSAIEAERLLRASVASWKSWSTKTSLFMRVQSGWVKKGILYTQSGSFIRDWRASWSSRFLNIDQWSTLPTEQPNTWRA